MNPTQKTFVICSFLCGSAFAAVPDGYLVRVDSATVYLDWGKASGVRAGDRFQVFREGATLKHPVSGEVLGRAEDPVGTGQITTVEEKFSLGHLETTSLPPKAGDRTRWGPSGSPPAAVAPAAATATTPETALAPSAPSLRESWRSDPLEKSAASMTFSDLDGDGRQDIVVAYDTKIQAYRWKDKKLEPLASFSRGNFHHWMGIDAIDLKHEGHDEFFATAFMDGIDRPRVVALRYENGTFKQVGDFEGFARVLSRLDGTKHLYWQNFSRMQQASYSAPAEVTWEKGKYRIGPAIELKLFEDQLLGFAWGDWDKDGVEDLAALEHGERIRLYIQGTKWKSSDVFGGTKNDFTLYENRIGSVFPRITPWRPAGADRDLLLVPTNLPDLGIRLTYLKIYRRSELSALIWNGLEMKSSWRLQVQGYMADYGLADVMGESKPQLWVAAAGAGDKTILLSYTLP